MPTEERILVKDWEKKGMPAPAAEPCPIPSSSSAIKYNNCDRISYEHDGDDDDDSEDDVIGDMIYKASNTARKRAAAEAAIGETSDPSTSMQKNPEATMAQCCGDNNESKKQYTTKAKRRRSLETKKICSHCTNVVQRGCAIVPKKKCSQEGCINQARLGGVCNRHGTKAKCSKEGCNNLSREGGVCARHGTKQIQLCSEAGV